MKGPTTVAALTATGSRTGRESQRYSANGERMVVGTIPFTEDKPPRILLINSRKHPEEWLLPKGGWEMDESRTQCAIRESWEEAGVLGRLLVLTSQKEVEDEQQETGESTDDQPLLSEVPVSGKNHSQLHTYYGLIIKELKDEWPERSERDRRLFSCEEAQEVLMAQERRKDRHVQCSVLETLLKEISAE